MTHATRESLRALVSEDGITFASTPILLPTAPYFDLAGEEFGARLILASGADGSEFCLRPDFTLPLATRHIAAGAATPARYGYLGPVFRQRHDGPAEFDQAGLELLAHPNEDDAFRDVLTFAQAALAIYGAQAAPMRFGSVALFEAVLAACAMPEVWRPRVRARFGHPQAMARLLERLTDPHAPDTETVTSDAGALADAIAERMLAHGLSVNEGRTPEEIATRYREKQVLDAAHVPAETIALLRDFLAISGPAEAALAEVETLGAAHDLQLGPALAVTRQRLAQFHNAFADAPITFDAGFSPRLDYYTGIVFEMRARSGAPLVSGGQYDKLLSRLGSARDVPAVGCAVWVDRLEQEAAGR